MRKRVITILLPLILLASCKTSSNISSDTGSQNTEYTSGVAISSTHETEISTTTVGGTEERGTKGMTSGKTSTSKSSAVSPSSPTTARTAYDYLQKYKGIDKVSSPNGLGFGIVTGRIYNEIANDPDAYFKQLFDMNVPWIRIEFEEYIVGAKPTSKETYIKIIDAAHKRGIKVLGIVGINSMLSKTGFPKTSQSVQNYIAQVEKRITEYKVDAVEICNEPLFYYMNNKAEDLHYYGELLIATYKALKPKYPNVLFVAPVTANAEQGEWLGRDWQTQKIPNPEASIFNCSAMQKYRDENNGKLPLDVISWHPYGSSNDDPKGNNFYFSRNFDVYFKEIIDYKDLKGRSIVSDYPIWFTEYGWDSKRASEQKQMEFFINMTDCMSKYPQIKLAFWYSWHDDDNVAGTEYKCYGLLRNSDYGYAKKPVFYSFFNANSKVGEATSSHSKAIIDCYSANGGRGVMGEPAGGVVAGSGYAYQVFKDKNNNRSAIIVNGGKAFALFDVFYSYYFDNSGKFINSSIESAGLPVAEIRRDGNSVFLQTAKGKLSFVEGKLKFESN